MEEETLRDYLWKHHEKNAHYADSDMEHFEKSYNQTTINNYKATLLSFVGGKVLETCAGTNRNLKFYKPGIDLTLVDWSPNMVSAGSTKTSQLNKYNYVVGDVMKLPFKDNEFDAVVDVFGLEYVLKPYDALQEMKR